MRAAPRFSMFINFYLGVNFAAFFQYAAAFIGRNSVAAAAEATS